MVQEKKTRKFPKLPRHYRTQLALALQSDGDAVLNSTGLSRSNAYRMASGRTARPSNIARVINYIDGHLKHRLTPGPYQEGDATTTIVLRLSPAAELALYRKAAAVGMKLEEWAADMLYRQATNGDE